jgi:hypothetical protein
VGVHDEGETVGEVPDSLDGVPGVLPLEVLEANGNPEEDEPRAHGCLDASAQGLPGPQDVGRDVDHGLGASVRRDSEGRGHDEAGRWTHGDDDVGRPTKLLLLAHQLPVVEEPALADFRHLVLDGFHDRVQDEGKEEASDQVALIEGRLTEQVVVTEDQSCLVPVTNIGPFGHAGEVDLHCSQSLLSIRQIIGIDEVNLQAVLLAFAEEGPGAMDHGFAALPNPHTNLKRREKLGCLFGCRCSKALGDESSDDQTHCSWSDSPTLLVGREDNGTGEEGAISSGA